MRRPYVFPLVAIPIALLAAFAVMWLWNAILPGLIGVNEIGYWQSLGLLILSRLLFGGMRGHHCGPPQMSHRRWEKLTPEEREEMRVSWRECCSRKSEPPEADVK